MAKGRKKKEPAGITPEFKDDVAKMGPDQKKAIVFNLQAETIKVREYLKEDQSVVAAKEAYDLIAGPAKSTLLMLKNRTKYIIDGMKDSGEL